MDQKAIAKRVHLLRIEKELTQAELAQAAGVAIGTVQSCERGTRQTEKENLEKIARILGTSAAALIATPAMMSPSEGMSPHYSPRVAALADRIATLDARFLSSVEAIVTTLEATPIPKESFPHRVKRSRTRD